MGKKLASLFTITLQLNISHIAKSRFTGLSTRKRTISENIHNGVLNRFDGYNWANTQDDGT